MTVEFVGGPKDGERISTEVNGDLPRYLSVTLHPASPLVESGPHPPSADFERGRYVLRWMRGEQVYLWEGE